RRGIHRGMRRKREDEHTTRTVPVLEAKIPPPKFDLAPSNFPPLPGSVLSVRGEATPEKRLSDVVRGLKVTNKEVSQEVGETQHKTVSEDSVTSAGKPTSVPPTLSSSTGQSAVVASLTFSAIDLYNQHVNIHLFFSNQEPRKLSYAEVCQRLANDPPPVQIQPLQELKVNKVEEPRPSSRHTAENPEKAENSRPPRQPLRPFSGANGQARVRGAGLKLREHQRSLNSGKQFSPQCGARKSGKEQNIPPASPK
uniref:Uncharacterized protein n=1 Tax=Monopterus albus TaxID=43700 RepID=A0A3Q3K317_MONAL